MCFRLIETSANLKLWFLVFLLYIADMWNDLENKIISYADDTTLYAEVASPSNLTNVVNSLNWYLAKIQSYSTW